MKKTLTSLLAAATAMGLALGANPAAAGTIGIQFAAYGAKDDPKMPPSDVGHLPPQQGPVNSMVTNMCQGQTSCTVPADNQHFGDLAPMHPKKLWISFNCSGLAQPLASVDEGHPLTISCPQAAAANPAASLPVISAVGNVDMFGVSYDKAKSIFTAQCVGKRDCVFTLHLADIGAARPLNPPMMYVQWDCISPDHSKITHMPSALMNDGQTAHFVCP
jgi:hypothetical protein